MMPDNFLSGQPANFGVFLLVFLIFQKHFEEKLEYQISYNVFIVVSTLLRNLLFSSTAMEKS